MKGTFAASTASLCGLAFIVLCFNKIRIGIAFAVILALGVSIAWVVAGQALLQLPYFFSAQWLIVTGYTNALSQHGPVWVPAAYLSTSVLLLAAFYTAFVRSVKGYGWAALLGMALTLWFAFKAGFVRQDEGHVLIAIRTLLLVAFCVCFYANFRSVTLVVAAAAITWASIANSFFPIDVGFFQRRIWLALQGTEKGILERLTSKNILAKRFYAANLEIKSAIPLAKVEGTVDLYPAELSAVFANGSVFANGLHWSGRPTLQSNMEYPPALNAANQ